MLFLRLLSTIIYVFMIRFSDIHLLYLRELRSALRERNIVVNSIIIPIFLYPLILWLIYTGISFVSGQTAGFTSRIMLKDLPEQHQQLKSDLESEKQIEIKFFTDPNVALKQGTLDVLVEFLPPLETSSKQEKIENNFRVRLNYDKSKDRSVAARARISEQISRYRDHYIEARARELSLPAEKLQQFWIENTNIASNRQMGQFILGLMLPMFLIIMLTMGGFYPAIDCTAGEREKSTWETLMTVATSRTNIVIAKYLYVATMSCMAGMLNLAAMIFSMKSILSPLLGERANNFSFEIPLSSIPIILLGTILLSLFTSAGMMILASFARTFKDGQSMASPFYIATFLPVTFLQVPGIEFTPLLASIPVVNVAMMFREAIAGTYHWLQIGITIVVEAACIFLALWLATTILKYEDFIMGSYDGSIGKFIKERLVAGGRR
jgi:sodium transport system permease protein